MNATLWFWITLTADLLMLAGLLLTWVRPSLALWPPPSGRSWQFLWNWTLFPVIYVGVGILPFLDPAAGLFPPMLKTWLGGLLLFAGLGLALWGVIALGWIRSTGIPGSFRIAGPYRWVRNPQYTGIIAALLGWGIWHGSERTLLVGLLHALWYALAPFLEERTLRVRFGDPYLRYLRSVPRFLPRFRGGAPAVSGLLLLFLVAGMGAPLQAQEVLPRVTLGGRGLFSLNGDMWLQQAGGDQTYLGEDLSDTYMLLRFDRKLYGIQRPQVAGVVLGFSLPDPESHLDPLYLNQVHVFWWGKFWEAVAGQTRLMNFLLEFPTLRDDDLLDFAFVRNAQNHSPASEYDLYGRVVRLSLFEKASRWVQRVQVARLTVTDTNGVVQETPSGFQLYSAEVAYRLPEVLRISGRIRKAGVRLDVQRLDEDTVRWLPTVGAALAVNLTQNPLSNWVLRMQGMMTPGLEGVRLTDLSDPAMRARARSYAVVSGISLRLRPYQLLRWRFSLLGGFRAYPDFQAWQATVIAGIYRRVGVGADMGIQLVHEQTSGNLASVLGFTQRHAVNVFFSFDYETMWNSYFTDRETLLNLEHGYAP